MGSLHFFLYDYLHNLFLLIPISFVGTIIVNVTLSIFELDFLSSLLIGPAHHTLQFTSGHGNF